MNIERFLKENSIKITKGRINIFNILLLNNNAITVEYIYDKLKKDNINVDLSTIYRNLELFNNRGIVEKYYLGDGKYSYIINNNKHTHIIECEICHKEVEIPCPIQQVEQIIKSRTGFTIEEEFNFKLKGICESCRSNK